MKRLKVFLIALFACCPLGRGFNAMARVYTTHFPLTENPISEGGHWISGRTVGLDWSDIATEPGLCFGLESGTSGYDDATALLTGSWGPDQAAAATVYTTNQQTSIYEEVEIRLRSSLSAHQCTGYEILFSLRPDASCYVQIVRWNGALNDFTYLATVSGSQYNLHSGDVVKASVTNNLITALINGVQVLQATDGTYASGNPGVGIYLQGTTGRNTDYGFTDFTATDEGSPAVSNHVTFQKGSYNGLFQGTNDISNLRSGAIQVTTTGQGKYSGALRFHGKPYPFSGQFSAAGHATNLTVHGPQTALTVSLDLNPTNNDQMTGRVTDGSWYSPWRAERAVFDGKTEPAPQAGTYTLLIPPAPGAAETPAGGSYGSLKIDRGGRIRFQGALADGTRVTQSAAVSKAGEWPFYLSLCGGRGSMMGWLLFTNSAEADLDGRLSWSKDPLPATRSYPQGFAFETDAMGSKYAAQSQILGFTRGQFILAQANPIQSFTNQIALARNTVSNLSSNKLKLTLNMASGLFKGSVAEPVTGRWIPISGTVLQKQNYGGGFFLYQNRSGQVYLMPLNVN